MNKFYGAQSLIITTEEDAPFTLVSKAATRMQCAVPAPKLLDTGEVGYVHLATRKGVSAFVGTYEVKEDVMVIDFNLPDSVRGRYSLVNQYAISLYQSSTGGYITR